LTCSRRRNLSPGNSDKSTRSSPLPRRARFSSTPASVDAEPRGSPVVREFLLAHFMLFRIKCDSKNVPLHASVRPLIFFTRVSELLVPARAICCISCERNAVSCVSLCFYPRERIFMREHFVVSPRERFAFLGRSS